MNDLVMRLRSYLDGSISREDFEMWFYDLAFDVEQANAPSLTKIVHRIEGILAESSSGNWPRHVLQSELSSVLDSISIENLQVTFN